MKISVSSYSFKQKIRSGEMTELDCVRKAKEMGFDGIEFIDVDADGLDGQIEMARKIKEEADRVGIEIVAYTIGANLFSEKDEECEKEVERLKGQLLVAKALGAPLMRHDVCYKLTSKGRGRCFEMMLPTIAENCRKVTEYAQTLGIKTCTENHGFIAQDSDRVIKLATAVNHDNYGLLVDIGNFLCADEDPAIAVSKVAPLAIHVHAKDMKVSRERRSPREIETRCCNYLLCCSIGEGDVPVKRCINILKKAGYDGYVTVEYEGQEDCIEGIRRGFENLKSFIG